MASFNVKLSRVLTARRCARTGMSYADLRREHARDQFEITKLRGMKTGSLIRPGRLTGRLTELSSVDDALDELGSV